MASDLHEQWRMKDDTRMNHLNNLASTFKTGSNLFFQSIGTFLYR